MVVEKLESSDDASTWDDRRPALLERKIVAFPNEVSSMMHFINTFPSLTQGRNVEN